MHVAFIWALLAVGGLLIGGILFWIAALVVRVENTSFGRAMLSTLFCGIVAAAVVAMTYVLTDRGGSARPGLIFDPHWLGHVLIVVASVVILRSSLQTSFGRAIAVLCGAVGIAVVLAILLMPVLALLVEVLGEYGTWCDPGLKSGA